MYFTDMRKRALFSAVFVDFGLAIQSKTPGLITEVTIAVSFFLMVLVRNAIAIDADKSQPGGISSHLSIFS